MQCLQDDPLIHFTDVVLVNPPTTFPDDTMNANTCLLKKITEKSLTVQGMNVAFVIFAHL